MRFEYGLSAVPASSEGTTEHKPTARFKKGKEQFRSGSGAVSNSSGKCSFYYYYYDYYCYDYYYIVDPSVVLFFEILMLSSCTADSVSRL